jgi:hypothetical protein
METGGIVLLDHEAMAAWLRDLCAAWLSGGVEASFLTARGKRYANSS